MLYTPATRQDESVEAMAEEHEGAEQHQDARTRSSRQMARSRHARSLLDMLEIAQTKPVSHVVQNAMREEPAEARLEHIAAGVVGKQPRSH